MDYKLATLIFQGCTFFCGIVGFCIIKFNDFNHIEKEVNSLKKDQKSYEDKQTIRHEDNLKSMSELSTKISYLCGQNDAQNINQ